MTYCLTPLTSNELLALAGPNFFSLFQKEWDKYMYPQRRVNIALGRSASIGKEEWEYAIADTVVGGEHCGAGKGIADVKIGTIGIDVKSIGYDSTSSAEASMFQKIKSKTGDSTSQMFEEQNTQALWDRFVGGWLSKVKTVSDYYMFFILRDSQYNCKLSAFKVQNLGLQYATNKCSFLTEGGKTSDCNLTITGIADPSLLSIKIYKSKSRMEVRVEQNLINDSKYCFPIYKF